VGEATAGVAAGVVAVSPAATAIPAVGGGVSVGAGVGEGAGGASARMRSSWPGMITLSMLRPLRASRSSRLRP